MMELTCAFILISASLVLATPHGYGGYGVKGGSSARAESSASAGAFGGIGGIPVPVPLGAGYSGSFSKSSSSNSASSSASSSSSSSSFSYSGSVPGGFGLNGETPGHGGCTSGNCQAAGGNGKPAPHGSSPHEHNYANAAASAGAGVVPGSGCQGLSCDGDNQECTSGQCKSKPQTETTSIDSNPNKCTAGQCGSALENAASPTTDYGSNDIRVITESSDSAHNAKAQSSSIDKASSAFNGAGSGCSQGKCDSSGSSPNYYEYNSENSNQGSSAFNKQQASLGTGITSNYQKPSTHLETPKLDSKCNSGNCNAGPAEPGHEIMPSSYNVPIHGTYDKGEPKPKCDGVKCENQPNRPFSSIDNSVTPRPLSFDYPSSTKCVGSNCFGVPASQDTGGPSHTVRPGTQHFGHSPSHVPTSSVPNCNSPNCSPHSTNPAITAGSNAAPGHIGHGSYSKPSDVSTPSNEKLPAYIGGFGGPAGVLNPNEYDVPASAGNPSHGHPSTPQNIKPLGNGPTGCNSPSCSVYPSASGSTGGPVATGIYNHKPGGEVPTEKLPSYTGGFGGPAGTLKPNVYGDVIVANKPDYAHPGSPLYNTQPPASNINKPGCKAGGNCGPTADASSGATAPSGYFGATKPNTPINSPNDKLPTYTGGFGGPGGVFNTDKHDIHATGPSSPGYTPSGIYNTPTYSGHPGGCKTPNCYPSLGSAAAANAQAESFGVTNPRPGSHLSSVTLPASYPSGYDRPSGVYRPNEISGSASTPSFTNTQTPSSSGSYMPGCKTGICANFPSGGLSVSAPSSPGIYMPGCKTGNCANFPSSGPSVSAPSSPGSYMPGCKTGNCANFPSSEPSVSAPSSPGSYMPGCKTGNCANFPSSGPSVSAPSSPGSYMPGCKTGNCANFPSSGPSLSASSTPGSYSSGCKTGNCANFPSSGPSSSDNSNAHPGSFGTTKPTHINQAAPTHPQYTGGVSGPSGAFKPNDHTYVTPSIGSTPANCRTPNCVGSPGPSVDAVSGANAHSGSYGITKPSGGSNPSNEKPIYTGGFGGASGLLKPNEYTISAASPAPNNKPTGISIPVTCTSGNCNPHVAPVSAIHSHNGASNRAHATAAAAAEANAVAYTGGFGGPPGVLTPYDDGKIGALPTNAGQTHGTQKDGADGSHNANIISQHGTNAGANSGPSGPAGLLGAYGNTGAHAGIIAGSAALAGATAGASTGAHGYNQFGSQHNHAGSVKGSSPCSGGCGGASGGANSGGGDFGFGISASNGFPKLGYLDGQSGGASTSGAAARSLAGANAFGVGGGYASSSATAHASAGAYTKGGYGKR